MKGSAQTPPVLEEEYSGKISVACVGDSITYGSKIEQRNLYCYPAQLERLLGEKFEVKSFGRPGARVSISSSNNYMNFPEYEESLKCNPDIVVISLGINDCSVGEWTDNKSVFTESYEKLIQSYQNLDSQPRIWLTNLMPVMTPYEPFLEIQENIEECQALIESLALRKKITLIDLFTELNKQHRIYARDGIHPSIEGAEIIAEKICSAITGNFGGLSLPYVFGDNMVIQRNKPFRIFGKGDVGDNILVEISEFEKETIVDGNGNWEVELPALKTGGPHTLSVSGDRRIEFSNVMVGEVWFCAGQSNMRFPLKSDSDAAAQLKLAGNYPEIRLLRRDVDPHPAKKVFKKDELEKIQMDGYYSGLWQVCSEDSAGDFSAVGYYFALHLYKALDVPVGIIQNAIGGAPMEAFMPREALRKERLYNLTNNWLNADAPSWHRQRAELNMSSRQGNDECMLPHHPYEPTFIYYADIEEMMPYVLRGVVWYQGESNATDTDTDKPWDSEINKELFKGLVTSWRRQWGIGDFPFYYVQLPNMNRNWMPFRQMQFEVLTELPALGMVVAIDIGDDNNVHPKSKYEVGRRLSLWARANIYGETDLIYSGPVFNKKLRREDGKLLLDFDFKGSGLATVCGNELKGFEVKNAQGLWSDVSSCVYADSIVLDISEDDRVVALRYAWSPNPKANLINKEGLPASPFYFEMPAQKNNNK
ncbi:GDSL-type esterase/lipase family protein [Limihaloglobus sulfuriphilus]|uniref:GDSL-type esterase/lipase family protein n=1 Tax=Limihaloglobus sulfuriphilus TaxID=1851148 RepID=UPI001649B2F3|nr:GDSL-type esterase/lipase family protein [Limihaloglobus sulfuriphilus]